MQYYHEGKLSFTIEEARLQRSVTLLSTQEPFIVVYNQEGQELCRTESSKDDGVVCKYNTTCELVIHDRTKQDLQVDDPELAEVLEEEKEEAEKKQMEDLEADAAKRPKIEVKYNIDSALVFKVYHKDLVRGDYLIGFAPINVSALIVNCEKPGEHRDWHSVFYNCERVGHILIQSHFEPSPGPKGIKIGQK